MKVNKSDYTVRIANATPTQLVVITYELILDHISEAKDNISDEKEFDKLVAKAREFLLDLRASLNMTYEISATLMPLYDYIDKLLAKTIYKKDTAVLAECEDILNSLLGSWKKVEANEEDKTPIIENSQQLYAGLTYGRNGHLNEFVPEDTNRGFKA